MTVFLINLAFFCLLLQVLHSNLEIEERNVTFLVGCQFNEGSCLHFSFLDLLSSGLNRHRTAFKTFPLEKMLSSSLINNKVY